jgi:hypothetical protein
MQSSRRNVLLLACCQALLLVNAVTLVAINGLAGFELASNKAFATLPNMSYVLGAAIATFPASLWMKRVGRRNGFLTGGVFGLAGSALAAYAVISGSMALLCLGTLSLGGYNACGQYYRFAAADAASAEFKAKAISYVLAGGVVGGIVGPELSKHTRGLWNPDLRRPMPRSSRSASSRWRSCRSCAFPPPAGRIPRARPCAHEDRGATRVPRRRMRRGARLRGDEPPPDGHAARDGLRGRLPCVGRERHLRARGRHVRAVVLHRIAHQAIRRPALILAGVAAQLACVAIALLGTALRQFLVGAGAPRPRLELRCTSAARPSSPRRTALPRGQTQGANEILIFAVQAISSLSSGVLVNTRGWDTLNYVALPFILLAGSAALWLSWKRGALAAA